MRKRWRARCAARSRKWRSKCITADSRRPTTWSALNASDVRIAIDAMGGDLAPAEVVAGACKSAKALGFQLLLVGDEKRITPLLAPAGAAANVRIVHAPEEVSMHEAPSAALRRGGQTSMGRTIELVRDGDADAAF